ncbi:hypothetical protein EDD21DRAFT_117877 [Dissophora ornata]|nr:hypothetical protein EDD21DRAFT_117877 [Dissophora ornata]
MAENISTAHTSSSQGTLYFAEANSETEMQEICRESEFERQLKEHNICVVEVKPLDVENKAVGQGDAHQRYSWIWNFPSRAHADDDLSCRKAVYAFLLRNPSCGSIEILSRFSFWIVDTHAAEQSAGSRISVSQISAPTANGRHLRHASTPERFDNRTSSHTKTASIQPSYASLPSLPDAAAGLAGSGVLADSPGSATGSSNLNPVPFTQDTEDGPLFRATVSECENHIRDMKASTKRIIKAAQTVLETRRSFVASEEAFVKELEGFKPADPLVNSYLRPMSKNLADMSETLCNQMRSLLIEPLSQFYASEIKPTEAYRKSFEDESKEYYQFLSRYMAMKQENNRKKSEADAKYEKKRRHFEIKRFEYWCFLQDMRVGGSKSETILHHLTSYSEKHCKNLMDMASLAKGLNPGLAAIAADLSESQKRSAVVYKERQERKKELLEFYDEGLNSVPQLPVLAKSGSSSVATTSYPSNNTDAPVEANLDILTATPEVADNQNDGAAGADQKSASGSSPTQPEIGSAQLNNNSTSRFSGIRDLEHQDIDASSALGQRKEGFLFATSRPSLHNNSAVLEKTSINWHKYWCVVSEGCLHEYSHWKKGATMLHNEPINLKISTVRPCRNQDRRFCFEVITPKYRRVYQATSTEDMNSWVSVISNAIQSLLNGTSSCQNLDPTASGVDGSVSATGRSSMEQSLHGLPLERHASRSVSANGSGDLSGAQELGDMEHLGTWLLKIMRETSPSNNFCAECGAKNPDWCAINLGILICIECSGIHRSLGTHISKVRSFTLDTTSYTRDLFDFIRSVGNEISNQIWEANLIQSAAEASEAQLPTKVVFRRPLVNDAREYKVNFIQKKYVHRAFVNQQQFSEGAETVEEMALLATKALFQAAIANNIPDVIAAFAAGADLNAVQDVELENETVGDGPQLHPRL